MPDPGLPPPTKPSNLPLDKWLHDLWTWVRTFVQRVVAGDSSVTVTTKNGVVTITANGTAPNVSYATVNNESATFSNARQLAAGTNVTLTDGGPGGSLTIAASGGTASPLTTKGDVWGYDTGNARIPVGADGNVLTANSGAALGVSWQAPTTYAPTNAEYVLVAPNGTLSQARTLAAGSHISITDGGAGGNLTIATTGLTASPLTTKGDVWGYTSTDARVAVGTDGKVLTADSTAAAGVSWKTPASAAAEFVLVAADGSLPQARVITAGSHISITDGGAGGNLTIATTGVAISPLTTKGDLWGFSSVDARVPVGSNGKVLTADSTASTGVSWVNSSGIGGMTLIQVITASGSPVSLDFTSIPGTFSILKLFYTVRDTIAGSSANAVWLRVNGDATAANYTTTFRIGSQNATAFGSSIAATTKGGQLGLIPADGNTAGLIGVGEVTIIGYTNTNNWKNFVSVNAEQDATNSSFQGVFETFWKNTAAITQLTLLTDGTAFKDNCSVGYLFGLG